MLATVIANSASAIIGRHAGQHANIFARARDLRLWRLAGFKFAPVVSAFTSAFSQHRTAANLFVAAAAPARAIRRQSLCPIVRVANLRSEVRVHNAGANQWPMKSKIEQRCEMPWSKSHRWIRLRIGGRSFQRQKNGASGEKNRNGLRVSGADASRRCCISRADSDGAGLSRCLAVMQHHRGNHLGEIGLVLGILFRDAT